MSDTAVILFAQSSEDLAAVYLHWGADADAQVQTFFKAEEDNQLHDNRFDDPEYLAARFVAWVSNSHGMSVGVCTPDRREETNIRLHCDGTGRPDVEVVGS